MYTFASQIYSSEHEIYQQRISYLRSHEFFIDISQRYVERLLIYYLKHENYTVLQLEQHFKKINRLHGYDAAFYQLDIIQFSVLSCLLCGTPQLFIRILNLFFQWIHLNPVQTGNQFFMTFYLETKLFEKLWRFYIPINL